VHCGPSNRYPRRIGRTRIVLTLLLCGVSCLAVLPALAAHRDMNPAAQAIAAATEAAVQDKEPQPNGWKIFFVLVAVFAVSLTAGGVTGKLRSPSFNNRTDIARYVAGNAKSKIVHIKGFAADGKLTVSRNELIRFPTGIVTWVYDAANPKPGRASFDPLLDGAPPPSKKTLSYAQALGAVAIIGPVPTAIQAGGQVGDMVKAASGADKVKILLGLLFAVASGFALGYKLAYVESRTCNRKPLTIS
jgi:hypothetical protein